MSLSNWYQYVSDTTARQFQVNDSPRYATFTHPGLNFAALDRDDNPDLYNLFRLTSDVYDFGVLKTLSTTEEGRPTCLIDWGNMVNERMNVVAATEVSLSKVMYNFNIPKWPLDVKLSFVGLGKSSITLRVQLFAQGIPDPILTRMTKSVLIDRTSHRPKSFPDDFREKLDGKGITMEDFRVQTFTKPARTFVSEHRIVWSETDPYNHTNFCSYVKFAVDTIQLAVLERQKKQSNADNKNPKVDDMFSKDDEKNRVNVGEGKVATTGNDFDPQLDDSPFIRLTRDIIKGGVKKSKICYLNESVEGDLVNVHVWQENGDDLTVRCSVEKKNSQTVLCQLSLEYFNLVHHL